MHGRTGSLSFHLVVLSLALVVASASARTPGRDLQRGPQGGPRGGPGGVAMVVPDCTVGGTEHLIDVGGRRLHGFVYGEGGPTVVLVSGLNALQAYWNAVVNEVAGTTTVVTYDRAGYGKSEVGELPLHGGQSARDLHVLLGEMGVPKPYLVVGHSYGVSVARLFASMYPDHVGGLILLDGQHEDILDEQRKQLEGEDLERLEEMVTMMESMSDSGTEMGSRQQTIDQLRESGPLPEIPFTVITAGDRTEAMPPFFSDGARDKLITLAVDLQQKLVDLVPGGRHVVAEGVGHNIQVEKPEVLSAPLIEMIEEIQGSAE